MKQKKQFTTTGKEGKREILRTASERKKDLRT